MKITLRVENYWGQLPAVASLTAATDIVVNLNTDSFTQVLLAMAEYSRFPKVELCLTGCAGGVRQKHKSYCQMLCS